MSLQKESENRPLYYYHLDKYTGEVTVQEIKYRVSKKITDNSIIIKFLLKIGGNSMTIYEYSLNRVSDMGIYMLSFSDDLEAAVGLFKKDWEKRILRQQATIEKAQKKYEDMLLLYDKISG